MYCLRLFLLPPRQPGMRWSRTTLLYSRSIVARRGARPSGEWRYSARHRILGHERPGWCYPTGRCAYLPSVTCYRQSIKPPPPSPPRSPLGLAPIGTRGLRHRECPSQSPSYSLEAARPVGRASARRVLEAAPGSATCDGRRFQDPELISLSPWHNGWTEITPFQHASALGGKRVLHAGVRHG